MVVMRGLEPPTFRYSSERVYQIAPHDQKIGAPCRIRTDFRLATREGFTAKVYGALKEIVDHSVGFEPTPSSFKNWSPAVRLKSESKWCSPKDSNLPKHSYQLWPITRQQTSKLEPSEGVEPSHPSFVATVPKSLGEGETEQSAHFDFLNKKWLVAVG